MDIFDILTLTGGLSLFLFGMSVMGQALERRAGGRLRQVLEKFTASRLTGFLTGLAVTAVIQSSSAATVMVVGFVNSGLMTLKQAIGVIMGANVGTTVTAWVLSLAGIDGGSLFIKLLKPSSFTPVLALVGIIFYMFCKDAKKKDTGSILLGFATLMFGMETMSGAVAGLRDVPAFGQLFLLFQNPVLGVLAGALLTAVIQSSSASVGILQALAVTGQVSYGAAVPIIMGQNIGTCVTAMLSSAGANKNAKRAALVHLLFNVIGSAACLLAFCLFRAFADPALLGTPASLPGIAVAHSVFNILCTALMLPLSGFLERLVSRLVPDAKQPETFVELDERLLAAPPFALERSRQVAADMAETAAKALKEALACLRGGTLKLAASVRAKEENFEGIADHAVNLVEAAEELQSKGLKLTEAAAGELATLCTAIQDILGLSLAAFLENDLSAAAKVEPLEQVVDDLKEQLRTRHIRRLQKGACTLDAGFAWFDLLTDLERTADHCSNIAACVTDASHDTLNLHQSLRQTRQDSEEFRKRYQEYTQRYALS